MRFVNNIKRLVNQGKGDYSVTLDAIIMVFGDLCIWRSPSPYTVRKLLALGGGGSTTARLPLITYSPHIYEVLVFLLLAGHYAVEFIRVSFRASG